MKLNMNRNKKILIALGCILTLFVLYKYFNVVEGYLDPQRNRFIPLDVTGLGPQARSIITGYNAIERIYHGGPAIPAIPATPATAEVLNPDNSVKTPAVRATYGTFPQPAVTALPSADKKAIKRALRNILAEIRSN